MALLDIEGSLVPLVADAFNIDTDKALTLVRMWRAKQMERAAASNALGLERTSFREATRLGLEYVVNRYELKIEPKNKDRLVLAWDSLDPWPEARSVIKQVKARGYQTAILSNGDQNMLDAVAAPFGSALDHVLSSESAGKYKPDPAVYALPANELGISALSVVHVAGSPNDVLGATACGMPCVWSNRSGDVLLDPAFPPLAEFPNLEGVLQFLD